MFLCKRLCESHFLAPSGCGGDMTQPLVDNFSLQSTINLNPSFLPAGDGVVEGVGEVDAGSVVLVLEVGASTAGVGLAPVVVLGTP